MSEPAKTKNAIDSRYFDGAYHERVFQSDPYVQHVVATRRAKKLQPLISASDTVFEFGVGTALNLRYVTCARKTGYDPGAVSEAQCAAQGIEFVRDMSELSDRTFSVVLCHHVLEHVENPIDTLALLKRRVVTNGRLLLYVPFEHGRSFVRGEPNMHLFSWTAQTIGNLVERAGFRVELIRIAQYGYEQRLARLAKIGWPVYAGALAIAGLVRPCEELQLVAV